MDQPVPSPAEARRPEAVPVSDELKQNYQQDIDRFEEEKFASRNSFPTKLLGWMLIACIGFQISGAIFGYHYDFGGLIFLFAGIYVLNGSQSALRFATFFIVPAAVIELLAIIWSVARHEPTEVNGKWMDHTDLEFWTLGLSPCMYFAAESIIATYAFRLRKIPFWTKTVRLWAVLVGGLLLLKFGFFARDLIRQREVRRALIKEVAAAKAYFSAYGVGISSISTKSSDQAFGELPRVLQVDWKNSPGSTTMIYRKFPDSDIPLGEHLHYQDWFKLPSGEWGMIEMEVILPENP